MQQPLLGFGKEAKPRVIAADACEALFEGKATGGSHVDGVGVRSKECEVFHSQEHIWRMIVVAPVIKIHYNDKRASCNPLGSTSHDKNRGVE